MQFTEHFEVLYSFEVMVSFLCFMAEEIHFQRGYGLPKVTQLMASRARVQTGSVHSAKRYPTNITHDGEN